MVKGIIITLTVIAAAYILPVYGFNFRKIGDDVLRAANPQASAQCFTVYSPQLATATEEYETQYEICLKAAENSKEVINKEVATSYATDLQFGKDVCSRFTQCTQGPSDSYGFFECNNEGATQAIAISYNIQTISNDRMAYMTMRNEMVTYDLNACTAKCSQIYIEDYADIYGKLQDCLDGKAPAETTKSQSVTTPTDNK